MKLSKGCHIFVSPSKLNLNFTGALDIMKWTVPHSGVFLFALDAEAPSLSPASTALQAKPQPTLCCPSNYKTYCQNRDAGRRRRAEGKWGIERESDSERKWERTQARLPASA